MHFRRIVALFVVLAVAGLPGPARAYDAQCHRSATGNSQKSCTFPLTRTPIQIRAETMGTNASVHLVAKLYGYPELPPVAECSARGSGFVECSAAFPDSTTVVDLTPHPSVTPLVLICTFEGSGSWEFACKA